MSNTKAFFFIPSILSFYFHTSHQPLSLGKRRLWMELPSIIKSRSSVLPDQNGDSITTQTMSDKIYVADFFFTRCPTICPKMARQMLRLHEHYRDNPDFALLSHSIDPKHDFRSCVEKYSENWEFPQANHGIFTCTLGCAQLYCHGNLAALQKILHLIRVSRIQVILS